MQVYFIPWSISHNVRELSGFFKDLRGTCLIRRLMALSLPGPDTLDAGIISKRWRNIERSSLEGSVSNSYSQLLLKVQDRKLIHTHTEKTPFAIGQISHVANSNINMIRVQAHQEVWLHPSL